MQIFINDEKIDFTLEKEKTVRDVFTGISDWLFRQNYSIDKLAVDENLYGMDEGLPAKAADKALDETQELKFYVTSRLDNEIHSLRILHNYFSLLKKAEESNDAVLKEELIGEFSTIKRTSALLFGEKSESVQVLTLLENFFYGTADPENDPVKESFSGSEQVVSFLSNFLLLIESRIKEASYPFYELRTSRDYLQKLLPRLEEVSVQLQTGQDREAMNTVITCSELIDKIIRIARYIEAGGNIDFSLLAIEGTSFERFSLDLNTILKELVEAFSAQDSILMGDLLEYEVAPRLESLDGYIELLLKKGA